MKENPNFRDELEEILKFTNGKRLLTCVDVGKYLGKSYRFVKTHYNVGSEGITAIQLAKLLSR